MIKRIIAALAISAALVCSAAAQAPQSTELPMVANPAVVGGPTGSPTYVIPPTKESGGVIDIGQALGPFLQPYVNAIVGSLLTALVSWVLLILKNKLNVSIDDAHRQALLTALKNQAGSLIADGMVTVEKDGKITVPNAQLAQSANEIMAVIPDAAARLGFTPDYLAKRIIDTIPQTAAGAAIVAAAQPVPVVTAPKAA